MSKNKRLYQRGEYKRKNNPRFHPNNMDEKLYKLRVEEDNKQRKQERSEEFFAKFERANKKRKKEISSLPSANPPKPSAIKKENKDYLGLIVSTIFSISNFLFNYKNNVKESTEKKVVSSRRTQDQTWQQKVISDIKNDVGVTR